MNLSVRAAAREVPDGVALVDGDRSSTWADVANDVDEALSWLAAAGVLRADRPGRPAVAMVADASRRGVIALFAVFEAGVAPLLLHPRWTAAEVASALAEFPDVPVITASECPVRGAVPSPAPPLADVRDDARWLAVLFTSGTSGRRRAAVLTRAGVVAAAGASEGNLGWRDDDRWLLSLSPAHVGGLSILTRCLRARRTVVLAPPGGFDPAAFARLVQRQRVTLVSLVPAMLARLLDVEPRWDPPPHLRAILLGGAAAAPSLLRRAAGRGWPVLTTYGLTESCAQVATARPGARPPAGVGPPLPGIEVRIVDGEIELRGPSLFAGYLEPGGLRRPFAAGGWFRTGDLGRYEPDGSLAVLGRRGDVIVSGGENVDPCEVEAVLTGYPGVAEAVVFGVADERWGEIVAALLVRAPGEGIDRVELARFCAARLAPFKRPRLIAETSAIPVNAAGKVERRSLAGTVARRLEPMPRPVSD